MISAASIIEKSRGSCALLMHQAPPQGGVEASPPQPSCTAYPYAEINSVQITNFQIFVKIMKCFLATPLMHKMLKSHLCSL